ncbi:hypothetical protein C8039_15515 [Halogeometricum sp. wsp3]|nr:hypothetical protein C8039_15515 [Halogeometricum sp. wsp3]
MSSFNLVARNGPNRADSGRSHETDGGVTTTGYANVTEPTDVAEAPEVTESTVSRDIRTLELAAMRAVKKEICRC